MSFVHLHNHSEYSLLDGASKVPEMVAAAIADGQPGIGITDHGNLYGLIDFYKECKKQGINPVLGTEAYMAKDSVDERPKRGKSDVEGGDDGQKLYYHLTLLAENNAGYANLLKLSSRSFIEGYYYKPRVDWDMLSAHADGVIATTGCLGGVVLQDLLRNDFDAGLAKAARLQDIFGRDNLFVELQNHGIGAQAKTNPMLMEISQILEAPLLVTNDCHYVHHDDHVAHDSLLCVQTNSKISDQNRFRFESDQHYLKSSLEMRDLFSEVAVGCDNTLWINERSSVDIDFGSLHLPEFDVPDGFTSPIQYLSELTFRGVVDRYGEEAYCDKIMERLTHELAVVSSMGFASYFLIVWDLIQFANRSEIRVGPGRGSACGSIISYALGITNIDPIRYDLIFERFLNPSRVSMPDIDLDFDSRYRDRMINYAVETYGDDRVAQIVTFGKIKARAAVRDSARVLGYPPALGDKLSKAMPPLVMGVDSSLSECLDETNSKAKDFLELYNSNGDAREVVTVAKGLEGLRRQDGIHAAAVVISDVPLTDIVPIQKKPDGPVTTQYEMHAVEELGLLKMDFLGLRNLDVISECLKMIGEDIDIESIPLNDTKTLQLLQNGKSIGVFQLESKPMQNLLIKMRPTVFDDIAALVALYRPGPMHANMHNDYADRKNGRQPIRLFHRDAEEILKDTYGLMIYQEQVMQVSQLFAGYSMAEADGLRKAMGKKIAALMQAEESKFVQGCIDRGYGEEFGQKLFESISHFSDYAFNKSHAYGYGWIAFQTAYLKSHYPAEYIAALCSSVSDIEKSAVFLHEAKDMGISVLGPDVNKSQTNFAVDDSGAIRVGLSSLKFVGEALANKIVEARGDGPFRNVFEFAERINPNSRAFVSLANAGALDEFGSRRGIVAVADEILKAMRKRAKKSGATLFDVAETPAFEIPPEQYSWWNRLANEKEVIGLYISGHPLDGYSKYKTEYMLNDLKDFDPGKSRFSSLCFVTSVTTRKTFTGATMANIVVEDQTGNLDVVVFPKSWEKFGMYVREGSCLVGDFTIGEDNRTGGNNYILNNVKLMEEFDAEEDEDISFRIYLPRGFSRDEEYLARLKAIIIGNSGRNPVVLHLTKSSVISLPADQFSVTINDGFKEQVRGIFAEFHDR